MTPHQTGSGRNLLISLLKNLPFASLFLILGFSLVVPLNRLQGAPGLGGSTGQAASRRDGQQPGGGTAPATTSVQGGAVTAAPAVTLIDHRTTGEQLPANCVAPTLKSSFRPTDTSAYQWSYVSGATVGDTVNWDFRQPNGSSYFQFPLVLNLNGNVCFSAFINIAGTQAASLLGTWEVRVSYNGVLLTTDTFTIRNDTVALTDHRITGTAPTSCTPPPTQTVFAPTDPSVYQWTRVSGALIGDQVRWEFVQPNGSIYATSNTLSISGDGDRCFWVSIGIAGQGAASLLGNWQVRVIYNDVPLLPTPDTFTIALPQDICPTVSSINPPSAVVGGTTTITGTNFTGVTAVRFANNVPATFAVNNATTITATVPAGAVTGPITLSKPNCADLQTQSFAVILQPVIEVTPVTLNFGNVVTGERAAQGLTVRNIGNAPLQVSSITTNNSQFNVTLLTTAFSLLPGASVNFDVTFAPATGGLQTATLSINNNDPVRPRVDVPLTGNGLAPVIEVTPPGLSFGDLRLAQTREMSFTIRNTGSATLKINAMTSSDGQFAVTQILEKPSNAQRSLPLTIGPGVTFEVTVRFRPSYLTSSVGTQNGVLSIDSNDPTRPRVDLPMTGTGLGPLILAPSSLAFGAITICSAPAGATLTLTNSGNLALTVAAISIDNRAFTLTPLPAIPFSIAPNESLTLNLSFFTRVAGTQTGRLSILSNAVNTPGLSVTLTGVGTPLAPPGIGQLSVSRTTLSHGRADNVRPVSPFNPFGLADVIGFVFPGAPLPANSIAPGVLPLPLIGGFVGLAAAIPTAPDPFRITLSGGVANPIVVSAANIPSCFTLVVAEGVTAPDLTRWERVGLRFGSGNLYASVSIPGTSIFAGMELVTEADFNAYTANSIIYEAPDFGLLVAPAGQNGGTATLQARARKIPADSQCQPLLSPPQSTQVEFSRTVRIEIDANSTVITRAGSGFDVTVTAQIFGNFDPAINTVLRWAYDGDSVDQVVDVNDMSLPGAPRLVRQTFHVPGTDECKLAQITVVASSTGNVPAAFLPPINPFLLLAPDSIGLFTFRSGGCTVEDTKTVLVRVPDSNCGGGAVVGWIRGIVTSAITGERIAGATVSVTGTNISSITGDDGTYELNNVPAGMQTLNASASGFAVRQVQVTVVGAQIAAQDISLLPLTGTLVGFVINAFDNQGIAGATVEVKGTTIAATSGPDGSYILSNVPTGPQTVNASAVNFDPEPAIVNIIGDQTVSEDFYLTPLVGRVSGIVRNATTNMTIAGASVTAAGITATTDGGGSYTLSNVPSGAQSVAATATGFNPASASVTVVAGTTANRDIAMMPLLGTVTGSVKNADNGDPIVGATVTVGGTGLSTTSGAGGTYTLINVPTGAQTLNASANGFVTTQAPGVNVVGNETALRDITLVPRTGTIQGNVTNAKTTNPLANASIEILPFPLSFASSDAGGNYTLTGVPTGQQVILATAAGFYAKLAIVNVTADQTSMQNFALTPKLGIVTGVVFDKFSQPVLGATVQVDGTNIASATDSDGRYTLVDVQQGIRTLTVTATGFRTAQVTVNVFGNETIYKDIYLDTPTGTVRGMVKNATNNEPIPGASILVGIPFGAVYYSAFTDGNGNYVLNDIPAGSLTIYVGADGFTFQQATVVVVANQTATQDFALMPEANTATGSITGTVRSTAANNPAVSGATVTVAGTNVSTVSSGDGSYTLSNVPSGPQTLNVSRTGFRSLNVPVTVTGGQTLTQNISLTPATGTVTGIIRNAQNGDALSGAAITLVGTALATNSGAGGTYTLNDVPAGAQTLNVTATGFSSTQVPITVTDGQTLTQNISLSPTLPPGEMRITLNWSKNGAGQPRDLDAHLTGPNPNASCFHVFYGDRGNLAAAPFAQLEVDNISISGSPPIETIRISKLSPGIYRFYVINFSNEAPDGISGSRATVQIFGATSGPTSFTVPGGSGQFWTVFSINGQTGAVTGINQLASPPSNCQ